ncbi:MAG TPA: hypothetical protein VMQ44_00405 [Candidatus Saccharimonadales bacterium]|nr:hypothetical protein [Candidatus Saccharimonadales bacterium]
MKDFFSSRFSTITGYLSTQKVPAADVLNIFSWKYWTESNIPPTTIYSLATIIVTLIFLIILGFWRARLKKAQAHAPVYGFVTDQIASIMFFIVVVLVAYAFFRYQQISYLSSRLVILASIFVIVIWLGVIFYYLRFVIPPKRASYLEKERFFRYLPKSKPGSR